MLITVGALAASPVRLGVVVDLLELEAFGLRNLLVGAKTGRVGSSDDPGFLDVDSVHSLVGVMILMLGVATCPELSVDFEPALGSRKAVVAIPNPLA